ncbi:uncharacterized protein LOC113773552 [Coffea eugenioides]|uniref:uncharacterized protein LOC113773552 n=1 Tax=Coffea eugenioides TaxID=49369 RepID=UPI000F612C57|nr:uncharacterized protein LOC113773552 [Coffea eugenioides]
MKIFSWMQSKLNGNQRSSKPNTKPAKYHLMHDTCKEEFSDWPSGLLAIGTFGNNNPNDPEKSNLPGEECPSQEYPEEFTHEEMREIHTELKLLLNQQALADSDLAEESANDIPQEKFFDVSKSFEDDRSTCGELISDNLTSKGRHYQSNKSIHTKGKNSDMDKKNNIRKRSLSFLIRKAFHRTVKPQLSPQFKDALPDLKLEKSILEKILRTILHKKVYPQSSTPKAPIKKCLDSKHQSETDGEDEMLDSTSEGSKWVKTDSDFIVLEI